MLQSSFITYKNSSIHYCLYGSGQKLLFCFHGYGEDAESFACLEEKLGSDYTLIAIDMPFHGETIWKEGLNFEPLELVEIIRQITGKLFNQSTNQLINLLGYSMGGRIALHLLQLIPGVITRAVLVAPDGLHKSLWYSFSTQTYIGNKVFKHAMYKPARLFWLLKQGERFKLAHPSIIKVAHYYLDDAEERIKLYERWTTMRRFKPNPGLLKKIIARYNIPVRFLFGKHDGIIVSGRSDILRDDARNVQVHVIEAGHRLMQQKYSDEIVKLFES